MTHTHIRECDVIGGVQTWCGRLVMNSHVSLGLHALVGVSHLDIALANCEACLSALRAAGEVARSRLPRPTTESARLIKEAREDDARMTPAPWNSLPLTVRLYHSDTPRASNSVGVARTRNNLPLLAAHLEASENELASVRADRDDLRVRLDAAQRALRRDRLAMLEAERDQTLLKLADYGEDPGDNPLAAVDKLWHKCGALAKERDKAQQRIAELEAERDAAKADTAVAEQNMLCILDGTFSVGDGTAQRQIERLTTTLRAIAPVYRATDRLIDDISSGRNYSAAIHDICDALSTARAALTPDLQAVIERACKETT